MSNRNQSQQPQNLRRTINAGLRAQNNNYDKIWYAINFGAYNILHDTLKLGVNSKPDLDDDYDDPVEEARAKVASDQRNAGKQKQEQNIQL